MEPSNKPTTPSPPLTGPPDRPLPPRRGAGPARAERPPRAAAALATLTALAVAAAAVAASPAGFVIQNEAAKLVVPEGGFEDRLGNDVAVEGDLVVAGAYQDDDLGTDSGAAFVWERQPDGSWLERQQLLPADGGAGDLFGISVDVSGERIVAGSYLDDDVAEDAGAAYVFERQSDGTWSEVAKLTASDGAALDFFGWSSAISGDTAVVGAYLDDDLAEGSGAAYVFERQSDGTWSEVAKLTASDGGEMDFFGWSVAVSGDTLLVGAPFNTAVDLWSGAAYLFERQGDGTWSEVARLISSDSAKGDLFGWSADLLGDRALVGAVWDQNPIPAAPTHGPDISRGTGSAYVFERQGDGTWSEEAKLLASDRERFDEFGISIGLSGDDTVLVGAWQNDDLGGESGSAYVFERQGDGSWAETTKLLASDGAERDFAGWSVAIDGSRAVFGSPRDDPAAPQAGSVYVFELELLLTVIGECPGELDVALTGATPDASVAFLGGDTAGTDVIPGGACAGTEVGIVDPLPLAVVQADSKGNFSFVWDTAADLCGSLLQAVDLAACTVSDVATAGGQ